VSPPGIPVITSSQEVLYGDGTANLLEGNPVASFLSFESPLGPITAAPVLGQGGLVYALNTSGQLSVLDNTLKLHWSAPVSGTGFNVSPNLDCNRDSSGTPRAGPGVLYVQSNDGMLTAILVDSHGLDTSSPWPRYQHDARNTGNSTTPIEACP
jgi:hypothetical protein